jgi:hypothetical protein
LVRLRHELNQHSTLDTSALEDAINTAIAAVFASSTVVIAQREVWVALALSTLSRDIVRSALASTDLAEAESMVTFAEQLARGTRSRLGDVVPSNSRDPVATALRAVLGELHESAIAEGSVSSFVTAVLGHLRHGCSQVRAGTPVDAIARAAVSRADRSEHSDTLSAWARATPTLRRAIVLAALCEASVAVAHAAIKHGARSLDVGVALARCTSGLLGAAGEASTWLVDSEHADESALHTANSQANTHGHSDSLSDASAASEPRPVQTETESRSFHFAQSGALATQSTTVTSTKDTTMTNTASKESSVAASTMNAVRNGTGKVIETLENDAQDAAWRLAGSQFVKLMRDPLLGLLSRHLAPNDESMRARIAGFLETEVGTALLSAVLSAALSSLPRAAGPVPDRLARELRVRAMADAGDVVADLVMGPMRQVVALYLQDPGFQAAASTVAAPSLEAPRATGVAHAEERVALS